MELVGWRNTPGGKLHLLSHLVSDGSSQMTVCGRQISSAQSLPPENFDFGLACCSICSYKHKHPVAIAVNERNNFERSVAKPKIV